MQPRSLQPALAGHWRCWCHCPLAQDPSDRPCPRSLPVFQGHPLSGAAGPCPGCAQQPHTHFLPHQLAAPRRCRARAWSRQASQRSGEPSDSGRQPVKGHLRASPRPTAPGNEGADPRDGASLLCARASLRDKRSQVSPSSLATSQVTATRTIGSGGGTWDSGRGQGGTVIGAEAAW